jgi:hypothetical protein
VIYGRPGYSFGTSLDLTTLDGSNGFKVYHSVTMSFRFGCAVDGRFDLNKDGFHDVMITDEYGPVTDKGTAFIIFGNQNLGAVFDLNTINGVNGVSFTSANTPGRTSMRFVSIDDMNQDGVGDYAITDFGYSGHAGRIYYLLGGNILTPSNAVSILDTLPASKMYGIEHTLINQYLGFHLVKDSQSPQTIIYTGGLNTYYVTTIISNLSAST